MTRKATNRILEMIEDGALDRDTVITACLKYMSEADVADMAHANEFFADDDKDEEDEDDEQHTAMCANCRAEVPFGDDGQPLPHNDHHTGRNCG